MVKVKVCGITSIQDALAAVECGADVLGFVFAPSPRQVSARAAGEIIRRLPPFVETMGVFVNASAERIREVVGRAGLDRVQLHGEETPDFCDRLMPRSVKALQVRDRGSLTGLGAYRGKVRALLLDAFSGRQRGGTGKTFDWSLALEARGLGMPVILAGGLTPDTVAEAVRRVSPYAVDVSSGIETRPGKKDAHRMKRFIEEAKRG